MNTILITGCSSGYGLATALHFHTKGWNVFAGMRQPDALSDGVIPTSERFQPVALDVTDPASIASALQRCGAIDVLVNNAGIGLFGAFEATPMSTVREVFETNTLGTMAMCQAVLPQFRHRRSGSIINVTSSAVLAPMPLVAAYTASKTAVEGFTASLALELAEFGIHARLVQPGYAPTTRFAVNGSERMQGLVPEAYAGYARRVFAMLTQVEHVTAEAEVADAVWQAATDVNGPMRRPAGADAMALARSGAS
ncbi:SDR family oxidoreductase [Aquincola tertiaricarbonis]|uniref:SDR family oxidoreductase n=1 Tax=Aquincola tertiaricarbonis TaxID=391953 RepID=UPI000614C472|nr:SDR family oxidoreductase [Aquincola tertiaricarbonis]